MGAWSLGRDAVLFEPRPAIPPTRQTVADADPRSVSEKEGEPPQAAPRDTMAELAGKVLAWIPGEVVVLYGALVTLFVQNDAEKIGDTASVILTVLGILFAGGFVVLAAWSNTSKAGWLTKRVRGRAVLASFAFLIWSLTVPNSGWNEIEWIAEHPAETTAVAGVLGLVFSLVATGADNRLGNGTS